MPGDSTAIGTSIEFRELPLFERADRWRAYWAAAIRPYLGASILEVGAGIGSATAVLAERTQRRWVGLEPDEENFWTLHRKCTDGTLPTHCEARHGDLRALDARERFDTILYVDVLEHIADDRGELARAADLLEPGGRLIVLAPAYQMLFTDFDRAIGHYRRYTRTGLLALTPDGLHAERAFYLDSVGILASLSNRLLMRTAHPAAWSIDLWNRVLVPASRVVDMALRYAIGKTVIVVWRRRA